MHQGSRINHFSIKILHGFGQPTALIGLSRAASSKTMTSDNRSSIASRC
jgi:hypothetical protein